MKKAGAVAMFLILTGCGQFIYFDGPYHGQVIDWGTKKPIPCAAVLAVWWRESGLLVPHPIESVYDAQETLTDENGVFTIAGTSGLTLNPTARIKEPIFIIFRPTYVTFGGWSINPTPPRRRKIVNVYERDGRTVIELRRFPTPPETPQQRQEQLENLTRLFVPSDVPSEKYPNLLRLKDEERIRLGLKPLNP